MKLLAIGALAVLGSGYTARQHMGSNDKPVKLRVEAATEGIVTIVIPTGEITVEGWRNDEIQVIGTLDNDEANIMLMSDHSHTELRMVGADASVHAKLHIRVPRRSNLDVETITANLMVADLEGMLRFESVDGSLTVDGSPRGVIAQSINGDIEIPAANIPGFAHSEQGVVRMGSGTGRSSIGRDGDAQRHARAYGQRANRYEHLGERVSNIISEALASADFDGLIDYDYTTSQLELDLSGSLNIDLGDLEDLFDGVGELLEDIEGQIGDEMALLGEELEELGDEIRLKTRNKPRMR